MTEWFEELETASVNGATLAFSARGTGEPVVFVHGSASDIRTWDAQVPAIGAHYRAIAYSRRFARPNADIGPDADDQMLPHVDDLVAFLRELDVSAAHLVGHSWGGFVSLLAAIRYPEVVRSLVLLEPPVLTLFVSTPPRPPELLRLLFSRPATALAIIKFGATAFAPAEKAYRRGDNETAMRVFGEGVLGKASFANLSDARRQQVRDNQKADRAQVLGAGFPPLADNEVRGVQAPTLLLVGAHSPAFLRHLSDRLNELLASSEIAEIADASHLMHEDNAPLVNRTILEFLARQAA